MIGLAGSHRTGKTALAKAFAEQNPTYTPVFTTVSKVYERLGRDPKADYPFTERLEIQRHILDELEAQYRGGGLCFIADRTPIDFIAYTLADVRRETLDADTDRALNQYISECIDLTNQHFAALMVVQPGITVVEAEGKAPATFGYMEHINALVKGVVIDDRVKCRHFALPRTTIDLGRRVKAVENMLALCHRNIELYAENLVYH